MIFFLRMTGGALPFDLQNTSHELRVTEVMLEVFAWRVHSILTPSGLLEILGDVGIRQLRLADTVALVEKMPCHSEGLCEVASQFRL